MRCGSEQENSAPVLCEEILSPSSEEIMEQACQKLRDGCFEDALDAFTHYLLLDPTEAKAYSGRGTAYFQLKKWALAADDFKRAREIDPEDLESGSGLAMSLAMDNKIYEAIEIFETLLARHPGYVRAHIQLGQLYYHLGVISKGHAQMDLALSARPSLEERRLIEQLQKEQRALDKRRYYRPDFEALRKQNQLSASGSWTRKITDFLNRRFRRSA